MERKQNITIQDFEAELQQISSDLTIKPLARPEVAGIFYKNVYLCACPNHNIYDVARSDYGVDGPGNRFYMHPTRSVVLEKVKGFLNRITKDKDYQDAFFGEGEYTDAKLASGGATTSGILIPDDAQNDAILNNPDPLPR
jgi:hypothetical protein